MKRLQSITLILMFVFLVFTGCSNSSNNSENILPDDDDNYVPPPVEEEILPTNVEIDLSTSSTIFDVSGRISVYARITPSNATNKEITWTSSNPEVAALSPSTTYSTQIIPHAAGTTTITATTSNGVSDTYELEVKPFCVYDFDLPITFTEGTSSYRKIYKITNVEYLYDQDYDRLTFNVEYTKTYDAKGSNNASSDIFARISVYDEEGYQLKTSSIIASGILLNDKAIDETVFFNISKSDAPFVIKIIGY